MSRLIRTGLRLGVAAGATIAVLTPAVAHAGPVVPAPPTTVPATSTTPPAAPPTIAQVLAPYAGRFDIDNNNFNIATHVLLQFPDVTMATAKPGSNTVFLPADYAFRALVRAITGKVIVPEQQVFDTLMRLGRTKIGAILKEHVLRNVRFTYAQAIRSNGKAVTTWLGSTLRIRVPATGRRIVVLQDGATRFADPKIIRADVRASNGIIHVIDRVLLPTNP
jgi:uncharacterized surface protein with fasciclin (FAS1) repeats